MHRSEFVVRLCMSVAKNTILAAGAFSHIAIGNASLTSQVREIDRVAGYAVHFFFHGSLEMEDEQTKFFIQVTEA